MWQYHTRQTSSYMQTSQTSLVSQPLGVDNYILGGRVHQKAWAYNSGSVGQDALPGPLHLLVQIVGIPQKILKWPEKKKPNFYSPPPPPTHTHTYLRRRNTQRIGIWKMLPIRGNHPHHPKHKICPLIPHKNISYPPTPYPLPLCLLYHNIDSSDQWRVQGDSGGSLWTKIISFSWRIFRKTIR